jgi:NAD+ kinase
MDRHAIHFVASAHDGAEKVLKALQGRYGQAAIKDADCVVALGGDGFMLRTLHQMVGRKLPVYGMKMGEVGFLMNRFSEDGLVERLLAAEAVELNPLCMEARTESGLSVSSLAINEVALLRQTNQAARIRISVNGVVTMEALVCDGVLLATAAGSSAYNLSAHGPILPLDSNVLALTPISPFRPRRWRGALLPDSAKVRFEVLDHTKRPVSATADAHEVRDVISVEIHEDTSLKLILLFDPEHSLEQRNLDEQFA